MHIKGVQQSNTTNLYKQENQIKTAQHNLNDLVSKTRSNNEHNSLKNNMDRETLRNRLEDVAKDLKEMVNIFNTRIDFSVHDDTNRIMVKLLDTETGDVIKEIPPEEILDLVAKIQKTLGILIDKTV